MISERSQIASTDSLPALIEPQTVKANGDALQKKNAPTILDTKQQVAGLTEPGKKLMDSLMRSGKHLVAGALPYAELFKKGSSFFKVNTIAADIEHTWLRDTTGISTGLLNDIQSTIGYDLAISLLLANMPFDVRLSGSNGFYNFYNTPYTSFPQFNFNHDQYLALLQKQVMAKINPDAVLASALSRINSLKGHYETSLKNEIRKLQQEFQSEAGTELSMPSNITDLSVNDLASLKNTVLSQEAFDKYRKGTELYQELNRGNYDAIQKDSLQREALQDIKAYETMEKIYGKIVSWKDKFDNNPLVKELRSHLPFTRGNFQSYLKNPGNLVDVIKGHASLSGIQKLFLNVTELDIGANPLDAGQLNLESMVNNGVSAEFTGKRSSAGIIYGSGHSNINTWMQAGLTSIVSNEYSKLMGIKFGSGWNSNVKQSLSLNFFDFNAARDLANMDPAMLQAGYLSNADRRDAVITWQSSVDVAPNQKISVDLSRSFGGYRNHFSEDSSMAKQNPFNDIFGGGGKANYAAAIEYNGDILATGVQLSFKKAGLGYNNPGNVFIRRGETRIGIGLNRKLLKQKLTVRYKADVRNQHFDPSRQHRYTNISNDLRLAYRLKRNTRVGISLRHNTYDFDDKTQPAGIKGSGFNLQGDGSYQFRIDRRKMINHLLLSRQTFDIPMLNGGQYTSKTWLLSHSSSLVLDKNLLTLSLIANRSDNKEYYFNTSFMNAELNYAFSAGDKIRLSSGVGFYSNTGWNKQLGIKQQFSGLILKKIEIEIDISWKKAVEVIRKELANQVFISSSVHYRF